MLATIVGPISASFNSFSFLSWITTILPIGASISQPLSGHLTDIFGRKSGLMLSLFVFAIGTLLCGLAPKIWVFLLGRVVQGLGGGAIGPITAFIETDLVPIKQRALIEGIGNIVYGVTLALGGVYGGAVQKAIGWKWAFLVQVPVIFLDIAWVFMLPIPRIKDNITSKRQADFMGMGSMLLIIILFQFGMNTGGTTFSWVSAPVLTSLLVAAAVLAAFIYWEFCKAAVPLIPIRALIQRTVASAQLSAFFANLGNYSIIYYTPIYLQVLGYSTSQSGLRFIPLALCFALGSFTTGFLVERTARYYYINLPVQVFSVLGSVLLCTMRLSTPPWALFVYLGLYGVGSGGAYVTRLMGVLSSVDSKRRVVVQAASFTIRNTGTTLGLTVASAIFQYLSVHQLQTLFRGQPDMLQKIGRNFEALLDLHGSEKQSAISIYLNATRGVFFYGNGGHCCGCHGELLYAKYSIDR
jgi:MFS family permease